MTECEQLQCTYEVELNSVGVLGMMVAPWLVLPRVLLRFHFGPENIHGASDK